MAAFETTEVGKGVTMKTVDYEYISLTSLNGQLLFYLKAHKSVQGHPPELPVGAYSDMIQLPNW